MTNESQGQSPLFQPSQQNTASASREMALKWLALLSFHYKVELTPPEIELYVKPLTEYGAKQLDDAFAICLRECVFMPKVAEIILRIAPVKTYYQPRKSSEDSARDKQVLAQLFADFWKTHKSESNEAMAGKRWTMEDGWKPREESWRLELERDARKMPIAAWHAPITGPNIHA